jgi:hypothetical protein
MDESATEESQSDEENVPNGDHTVKVARFLVEHFISFKGCDHHDPVDSNEYGMRQFIRDQQSLEIPYPDFAEDERLPAEARANDLEGPDKGIKMMKMPLSHSSPSDRGKIGDALKQSLTGLDQEGQIRRFYMGSGDLLHHSKPRVREMAQGKLTLDIDSVLSLFTDLSMVNRCIDIFVVWSAWRNLDSSVHITHQGVPIHRIPHLCLGRFGYPLHFDLYLLAPKAYDPDAKVKKGVIPNRLSEATMKAFMDDCFLKAIHKVLPSAQRNKWPTRYEIQKMKSTASATEGRLYNQPQEPRHAGLPITLAKQYIDPVWTKCIKLLRKEIRESNPDLLVLDGFQLFICSKNTKDIFFADNFRELKSIYKNEVPSTSTNAEY